MLGPEDFDYSQLFGRQDEVLTFYDPEVEMPEHDSMKWTRTHSNSYANEDEKSLDS